MFRLSVSLAVMASLATFVATSTLPELTPRAAGGYMQHPSGTASFTGYSGCDAPACGITGTGFTAAMSQLSFGAAGGDGPGDACGRCFAITAKLDPYSPWFTGPFTTIVVKVTNLCPGGPNNQWCGQTQANPTNAFGASVHFDLCEDTGAAAAFFPSGELDVFSVLVFGGFFVDLAAVGCDRAWRVDRILQ